jgi:protein-tyrosine phosphatase
MIDAGEIIHGLWQGSAPPHGAILSNSGYDMVVLCALEFQPPAEAFPGVHVLRAPLVDVADIVDDATLLARVRPVVDDVVRAVRTGHPALVTCYMGLNRSGFIAGLALHELSGWTGDACVRRIRDVRGPYALSNSQFRRIVTSYPIIDDWALTFA